MQQQEENLKFKKKTTIDSVLFALTVSGNLIAFFIYSNERKIVLLHVFFVL